MDSHISGTARARRFSSAQGNFFFVGALAITVTVTLAVLSANPAAAGSFAPALSQPQYETTFTNKPVKSRLGQMTQTDPSLLGRTDSTPINVMVKLDYDALASYEGNIPGYAATSPKKTGKKLKQNQSAVSAYAGYIVAYESKVLDAIKGRVPAATVRQSFRTVYGGVAMTLPANKIGDLLSVNGVVAVQDDALAQPLTDVTPAFLGADQVWPSLGGSTKAGEGVIVGVLDTGIWPEHPSFADHGLAPPPGGPFACQFGVGGDAGFSCNNKLVGAYAFLNTYTTFIGALPGENCIGSTCSARDADGHGTHTSSTAAGGPVDHATLLSVDRGHISGMAPGAHVIMYRVCLDQGCFQSDSVAAVDQAINDGVDIINFSISGGASAYTDPVEGAFFDAYAAGTLVNASAGNSGPGSATAEHAGPWTNTVGASTSNRHFLSTLHLTSTSGATLDVPGVTVTAGTLTPTDVVLAIATATDPNRLCLEPAPAGTYTGKVVICRRGINARVDKGYNVLQGGAAGMILYNTANQDLESDNHWLSAIHINGPSTGTTGDSAKVLAFMANPGVKATWANGTATPVRGDVMAAFSSRGPVGDFIKPDVTAPGVQILAGNTPQPHPTTSTGAPFVTPGPPGQFYQAIAGTSMSSPHSAGVAALIKAAHPNWTPGQIKSALMTSSVQDTLKEDGVRPATPFDRGAGAIRANRAVSPTVTFDVDPTDYLASASDPLGRISLNLPSVNAPTLPGQITTWRTMRNVTNVDHSLQVSVQAPPGVQIIVAATPKGSKPASVSDKSMAVIAGQETTFQVTINAPTVADGQYFGQITLDPKKKGYNPVVIPVAFNKRQGQVTLTHDCTPTTFATTSHTDCTVRAENFVGTDASVNIEVDASAGLEYSNVSAPATLAKKDTILWSGTLIAATPPDISIGPGSSPAGGYLPLSAFGVPPIAGVGDDTLTNFNVPAFLYGGEVYSRMGISSNGYLVIGGGSGADNTINNQNFPDPTRPNNVIAAFWTDLNPAAAGAVRIATLTDGSDTWIVVDWQGVREFSTAANTHSFEIWIGINSDAHPGEDVSIAYGPNAGNGDSSRLTVGAENKLGNRGANFYFNGTGTLPVNGTQLRVTSSPPVPGGNVTFTYDASAKKAGSYSTTANMTSNLTPGTTQDVVPLTVTP